MLTIIICIIDDVKIELNEIYNMDAIEFMKEMRKQEIVVDAVITDPPYNISRNNNFETIGRSGIDFGECNKGSNKMSKTCTNAKKYK